MFGGGAVRNIVDRHNLHELHAKIRELTVQRDPIADALGRLDFRPQRVPDEDLGLMRRIDESRLQHP
jgi:hypothetical protein